MSTVWGSYWRIIWGKGWKKKECEKPHVSSSTKTLKTPIIPLDVIWCQDLEFPSSKSWLVTVMGSQSTEPLLIILACKMILIRAKFNSGKMQMQIKLYISFFTLLLTIQVNWSHTSIIQKAPTFFQRSYAFT